MNFRFPAIFIFLAGALLTLQDAEAARRSLRIDFNAWSEAEAIESCRGYTGGAALFLEGVTFFGGTSLSDFTPFSYCQTAIHYEEGLTTSKYLNSEIFEADESALAAEIGTNTSNDVTARKYTYLNELGNGFQWAFYDFPSNITLVSFYASSDSQSPYIRSFDGSILWDETYNGEYFCFVGGEFTGLWDESTSVEGCTEIKVPVVERNALLALYNSTDGDNWSFSDNWLTGDPCIDSWYGVTCGEDDLSGGPIVIGLDLVSNQLNGTIPAALGDLAGLGWLTLQENQLSGPIPAELGNLTILGELNLASNQLTGTIPGALGNLTSIGGVFSLADNQLTGAIPPELGNLTYMWELNLAGNQLTGAIPGSLANLSSLGAGFSDLRWNELHTTDSALDVFLDGKQQDGDWSTTQTIPPVNLTITGASSTTLSLAWDAIEYTGDTGRYRVWYSTSPEGPFVDGGTTASKLDVTYTITGLEIDTPYHVSVRTETDAHGGNLNELESENSGLVSNTDDNYSRVFVNGFE
jgi:hypothetical protein